MPHHPHQQNQQRNPTSNKKSLSVGRRRGRRGSEKKNAIPRGWMDGWMCFNGFVFVGEGLTAE